ncbi:SA1002 family membrane protein [Corynebacterium aquilae]|uniref:Uncharacterized protein n=1 Tax=Corynebacterium aquilae DSM 44791 TaxID=1431546 RepID=A0A1L7CE98_9CORY|nr:hypothetical protein [Corynebacterium aquilae]APT84166.1 hypothetical protein CAQU_02750 [Corynebacterium aquilae DSM 44791]
MATLFNLLAALFVVTFVGILIKPRGGTRGPILVLKVFAQLLLTAAECILFILLIISIIGTTFWIFYLTTDTGPDPDLSFSPDTVMLPTLAVLAITGASAAWAHRHLTRIWPALQPSEEETEMAEYVIQWSTIYLTVYQLLFQTLSDSARALADSEGIKVIIDTALNPNNINLIIMPLLFSVWMALAIEKLHKNFPTNSEELPTLTQP